MGKTNIRTLQRSRRKRSIRKHVHGTTERPRLVVYRSLNHTYAQVIDDSASEGVGRTVAQASTASKDLREACSGVKKREAAEKVGELLGQRCVEQGIQAVVFDRNGFRYHGRVAALADGARKAGLKF